ncbi:armadillo-type protein [Peziza echinospora]|nr:armadillo-type protein [Peziza echinospora]KAI5783865.1 armadillo-type protein [Peziza echinospora]
MSAPNGVTTAEQAFAPVLVALTTMQSNVDAAQKQQAHEYLEQFQKSPEAWTTTHAILQSQAASIESRLFAATTLKGKVTYDIHQLPRESLTSLRDSLLNLLFSYRDTPQGRPIRTQLSVSLASLALQMTSWKDVVDVVVLALNHDAAGSLALLEFLTVLPEEVTEGRKVSLTEEELDIRTKELLDDNADKVLSLLAQYAQSTPDAAAQPALIRCLTSWLREISIARVVSTPLIDIATAALNNEPSFEAAVECLCAIFRETRDVDECAEVIKVLYPRVISLQPKIEAAAQSDPDVFKGFTRIFAEAGEAWVVLIARQPVEFRKLVEAIRECAARDAERDVIHLTFNFWYELKNYLVLEKYIEARVQLADIYSSLVDVMVQHLQYPRGEGGNEEDLFDGDREQEEKFREFRHSMGDVLKDSCEVVGATDCLSKVFARVQAWLQTYSINGTRTPTGEVVNWQELEAPLFSMRAMGRMVPADENQVLPQIMQVLVRLPEHEKVRFAATLVLGRYTEWTSRHPEYLESQLNYITNGFSTGSKEVTKAAAMALKFFCQDCGKLLTNHVAQLHQFYEHVSGSLLLPSLYDITDGVAHVIAAQPLEGIYDTLKLFCQPIVERLMAKADRAHDDASKCEVADYVHLLTIFVQVVKPNIPAGQPNPMITYWTEIFPILTKILETFVDCLPICERISRCFRSMLISYRTDMLPLLPTLAEKLVYCFEKSQQGCFLWVSGAVVREFVDDDLVDEGTRQAVYSFLERQCLGMFRILNGKRPEEMPDVIEDFFRLLTDGIMFHPQRLITSSLLQPIFEAGLTSLNLEKFEPLIAVLHFYRDLLMYGDQNHAPTSISDPAASTSPEVQQAILNIALSQGENLTKAVTSGLMYSFPRDCVPDASGVILALVQLVPDRFAEWMRNTLELLPPGSVSPQEAQKVLKSFEDAIAQRDFKKVRYTLQDFTSWYRRKNVTPRSAVTGLDTNSRFRFSG